MTENEKRNDFESVIIAVITFIAPPPYHPTTNHQLNLYNLEQMTLTIIIFSEKFFEHF